LDLKEESKRKAGKKRKRNVLFDEISNNIVCRKEKDMIEKNGKEKQTNQ